MKKLKFAAPSVSSHVSVETWSIHGVSISFDVSGVIRSCFVVLIRPRATRAAKMNKRSWELWWRILRRRRTLMTFTCWCFCTYHCVGTMTQWSSRGYHMRLICLFLMLTSADCMIQTTRCSSILFFETKCFVFFYIPRLLGTVRDILRPWDFRCWCREHGFNRPWNGPGLPSTSVGWYRQCVRQGLGQGLQSMEIRSVFLLRFLEFIECKTMNMNIVNLWLAHFFVFKFNVDWTSQFLIPALAGHFCSRSKDSTLYGWSCFARDVYIASLEHDNLNNHELFLSLVACRTGTCNMDCNILDKSWQIMISFFQGSVTCHKILFLLVWCAPAWRLQSCCKFTSVGDTLMSHGDIDLWQTSLFWWWLYK